MRGRMRVEGLEIGAYQQPVVDRWKKKRSSRFLFWGLEYPS